MKRLDLLFITLVVFGGWSLVNSYEILKTTEFISLQSNPIVVVGSCSGGATTLWCGATCYVSINTKKQGDPKWNEKGGANVGYWEQTGCVNDVPLEVCFGEDQFQAQGDEGNNTSVTLPCTTYTPPKPKRNQPYPRVVNINGIQYTWTDLMCEEYGPNNPASQPCGTKFGTVSLGTVDDGC